MVRQTIVPRPALTAIFLGLLSLSGCLSPVDKTPDGFVLIPGGSFLMGNDRAGPSQGPRHSVRLSGFYLATALVTEAEYGAITKKSPKKNLSQKQSPNRPVEQIGWLDAVRYCNLLSQKHGKQPAYRLTDNGPVLDQSANGYRLPSEAQWEFAARSPQAPADMVGRLWQWCSDWFGDYPAEAQTDPQGPATGRNHVVRGGSFLDAPEKRRADYRTFGNDSQGLFTGFRLVLPVSK